MFDWLKKVETPDVKELGEETKKIRTELRKVDVNTIKVEYFLRNSPYYIETTARLYRLTNHTLGIMEEPNDLGFIMADDSIYYNKATKREKVHVKEGYPFSLKLDNELTRELDAFKKEHPKVKEYLVPVMINQIPVQAVRVKLKHKLPGFPNEMEVTQNVIYQLFWAKILSKVNKQKIQGAFVLVLVGFLGGGLFGLALSLFILK